MSLGDKLRLVLTVEGSSRRIAFAFALGVFVGMSPFLGLHTLMAIGIAVAFRFNKVVTLAGAYITNPWTIIPIYTFSTWLGVKLTGSEDALSSINFHSINIFNIFRMLEGLLVPFFVGTLFVGSIAGVVSYFIVKTILRRMREDS